MSTPSANMSLPIPSVGTTGGPDYAENVNAALTIVDQHSHIPGSGVPITPQAIDINSALTLSNNFLTEAAGMTFTAQTVTPANGTVYLSGDDLYFVDALGNDIQITQNGGIAGTSGSISNLVAPASASYVSVSSTFVFQSNANIAANLDAGSLLLRNITPNSTYALTLAPPAGLGANYSLTLPALPSSKKIMALDATGAITAPYTVDGTTLEIASNLLGIKDSGVTTAKIANFNVTADKLASSSVTNDKVADLAVGTNALVALAVTTAKIATNAVTPAKLSAFLGEPSPASPAPFTNATTTYATVTNMQVTLTGVSGLRPVRLEIIPDTSVANSFVGVNAGGTGYLRFLNTTTGTVGEVRIGTEGGIALTPMLYTIDEPAAGDYTYAVQIKAVSGSTVYVSSCRLLAYEM